MNSSIRVRAVTVAAVTALAAITLTACSAPSSTPSAQNYVSGGTFVAAISSDPGSLVPMTATAPAAWTVINYAYESLAYLDADGDFVPWLAKSWEETPTKITYTLRDDITCSDGTSFTAKTAAANINYHADPAHATFYYGSQVTEDISASAEGDTLTITSKTNNPFLLANTGTILLACQAGLDNPTTLTSKTDGTGLFALSEVEPQTSYTFTKRTDYTWGPDGVTSDTEGLPDKIQIRVISDESTATNLLLSGDVNAAIVLGSDRSRLDAQGLKYVGTRNPIGEILFNEKSDRITTDQSVREALMVALNRDEVADVVTDGTDVPALSLVNQPPMLCVKDTPDWSLPKTDAEKAGTLLDEAGWVLGTDGKRYKDGKPLTIKFVYDAGTATHAAAAELVKKTWDGLGVTTTLTANDATAWSEQLWKTFDWDTGFVQIAPGTPVVLSTFFDGKTPQDSGLNFMFVNNSEYSALAAQAREASNADDACSLWQQAEVKLIERTDAFPLADAIIRTYMAGAVFDQPSNISPTSIRMLG